MQAAQPALKLNIHKTTEPGQVLLQFDGVIDEEFAGAELAKGLTADALVLDLAGIKRLTSFGIREWVGFIDQVGGQCRNIYFVDCSPRVVVQMNMVVRFLGRGAVLSVMAPYVCNTCGASSERRIDVFKHDTEIRSFTADDQQCDACNGTASFDDDPSRYFSYLAGQARPAIPPEVAAFLARHLDYQVGQAGAKVRVAKLVEGDQTIIRLIGEIGNSLPIDQLKEGLEGEVVLDMSGATRVTPTGGHLWRTFVGDALLSGVPKVRLFGCSPGLLPVVGELLSRSSGSVEVHSVTLPYRCDGCSTSFSREVSVIDAFALRNASAPPQNCPDCTDHPMVSFADQKTLVLCSHLPVPLPAPHISGYLETARQPVVSGPAPEATPSMARGPARQWPLLVGAAALAAICAAAAVVLLRRGPEKPSGPARYYEASHLAAPGWRDKRVFVEEGTLFSVARSTMSADKATAFAEANHATIEQMLYHLVSQIGDPTWYHLIGVAATQQRDEAFRAYGRVKKGDRRAMENVRQLLRMGRQRVAHAWGETSRHLVPPSTDATYWESYRTDSDVLYRVWARARLTEKNFHAARAYYREQSQALGATVVPFFPLLAWKLEIDRGAIAIAVDSAGLLGRAGLRQGDIVLRVNEQQISDGLSFKQVAEQTQHELQRVGGTLTVEVVRLDGKRRTVAAKIEKVLRPAGGRSGSTPGGHHLPPANIWHDDPSN